jgi:hypothetical protein
MNQQTKYVIDRNKLSEFLKPRGENLSTGLVKIAHACKTSCLTYLFVKALRLKDALAIAKLYQIPLSRCIKELFTEIYK